MLACRWLFLRVCGHLANARDRDGAKRNRGTLSEALFLSGACPPQTASHPPKLHLIPYLLVIPSKIHYSHLIKERNGDYNEKNEKEIYPTYYLIKSSGTHRIGGASHP